MRGTTRLFCGCAVVCLLVAGSVWSAPELPEGFRLEPVVGGLTDPSALARTSDGSILIAERTTGNVRIIRKGQLDPSPLCTVGVNSTGDGGLLGLAPHPNYVSNGWLYLYYTSSSTNVNKVTRMTVSGNSCSGEIDIISDLGAGAGFLRNGGGLAFGPGGRLYVTVGDMEDSGNAQDDGVLQGKVLHVNDDGSTPPGGLIYAKGIRDGRGVGVKAGGEVYMTDAGDDPTAAPDEINPVPEGGNLGWDNPPAGDVDPYASWLPTIGIEGMSVYAESAFPDAASDGIDNDRDAYGPDVFPGRNRKDDNGVGECVGGETNGGSCTVDGDCVPRPNEDTYCQLNDEIAEYCPGGVASGDDICGNTLRAGIDEPDESYMNNVFMASGNSIVRWVDGISSPDVGWDNFLDSNALPDCPTGWSDVMAGSDGHLYALATNGGGAAGALYRVIHDGQPGPREVSAPGSHFPVMLAKSATPGDVDVYWEDLRTDAMQPRDNGTLPTAPVREYTIWEGEFGSGNDPVPLLNAVQGNAVNDAVRNQTGVTPTHNASYFLVSARHDNLEGTLGEGRPGYAVTDLCDTIGYHSAATSWAPWLCGQDFTLQNEFGEPRSLYDYRGKAVVIDWSAVWCIPCHNQANVLEAVHDAYKDRGVVVLTVLVDDDVNGIDWEGRPNPAECRNWGNRGEAFDDHTFSCWADPEPNQQAWPKYNAWTAIPTNTVFDQGMRVVYTTAGYPASAIAQRLDALVGATDVCLH